MDALARVLHGGTDCPYLVGPRWEPLVRYVEEAVLSREAIEAILAGKAQAHFGLPAR